ncbi:LINE-1 retrotransposable element ORF2 protein [Stylophora pistillata]|uniref:LINE-1 retrotransposable element ORF2 protein n=1 Tax=Stylophora pistillata TaxID=50429 RepID=A0A2B4RPF2_STYPI|nr:LINE-1 retrotransposable element ORF2 protein [Stylophora pistillata]
MTLRLMLKSNQQATVISAYAPTLQAEPEDNEIFYSTLDSVLTQIPSNHKIILLGDFNARVGRDHSVWENVIGPVAGKDGTLDKDLAGIRDRWKEHFCELLNQTPSVNIDAIANLPQLSVKSHLDETPTLEDIATAIGAMKKGKAAGPDGIPAEAYKAAGPALIEKLHVLFTRIWDEEVIPSDLQDALIVTIFKKGDKANCENYRGISLLSIAGKIFARILACRLFPIAEEVLPESQCGFRPARGTVDMIFSARQIQEKCREQHKDLYKAFIDLTKAFDSIHRPTLWKVLSKIGCPEKYIRMIRLLHDNMSASVLIDGESTESFVVKTGVKQGCVIAPTLFSIFISAVLHLVVETSVTTTDNSPSQDYTHPDEHTTLSHVTPGFKPFTAQEIMLNL